MSINDPDINRFVNIFKLSEMFSNFFENTTTEIRFETIFFEICDVIIRIEFLDPNAKEALVELINIFFKMRLKR
jgi:hypothetical protein